MKKFIICYLFSLCFFIHPSQTTANNDKTIFLDWDIVEDFPDIEEAKELILQLRNDYYFLTEKEDDFEEFAIALESFKKTLNNFYQATCLNQTEKNNFTQEEKNNNYLTYNLEEKKLPCETIRTALSSLALAELKYNQIQ